MQTLTLDTAASEAQVERLLAAARETIAAVRYCWVATQAEDGGAHARTVRVFGGAPDDDEWTRRFLAKRTTRKLGEIRRSPRVTLAYQHDSGDRYVALVGRASVVDTAAERGSLWQPDWDQFFPAGFADANMIVVRVEIDRIEIHARGVTAEPFGFGRTLVERTASGKWRLVPEQVSAT